VALVRNLRSRLGSPPRSRGGGVLPSRRAPAGWVPGPGAPSARIARP